MERLGADTRKYRRERRPALKRLVAEVYSRPRVTRATALLPSLGLLLGFALDLTTTNKKGDQWDFTIESMRQESRAVLAATKPALLIGSPPCTEFCAWQLLNAAKLGWTPAETRRRRAAGEVHVRFCGELYAEQITNWRVFLHEHPDSASSWKLSCIQEILAEDTVDRVIGDQCQYGQATAQGDRLNKAILWISNSPAILEQLKRRCRGRKGFCSDGRRHGLTSGQAAREAAAYPFRL